MDIMGNSQGGVYSLYSKSDPRWNVSEEQSDVTISSGDQYVWGRKKVSELKQTLGEPPSDLTLHADKY